MSHYNESIQHIQNINAALATEVSRLVQSKRTSIEAELSLKGGGFWHSGSDTQHKALRALMLCQIAFFRPPHSSSVIASTTELNKTKTMYKGVSTHLVDEAIRCYQVLPGKSLQKIASEAERANQTSQALEVHHITRTGIQLGQNPICYNGLTIWLFNAGYVSKMWLAKEGSAITANNADTAFGLSQGVPVAQWGNIPAGHIWTIQRKNDPTTCHWGVSLGNGKSAATNNTPGSPCLMLPFISGGSVCGTFLMVDMCKVLNSEFKYGHLKGAIEPDFEDENIVLKTINPSISSALY